jgi:hypothetical protein
MDNQEITTQDNGSKRLHYVAYTLLIFALIILGYLQLMPQKSLQDLPNSTAQSLEFKDLPDFVQLQYRPIDEVKRVETKLDDALKQLSATQKEKLQLFEKYEKNNSSILKSNETTLVQTQPSVSLPQEQKMTQNQSAVRIDDFTKCYDMEVGKYAISKQCHKNITAFVDKHKNAKYFEIIGIVDETEFTLFKNLEHNNFIYNKLNVTQESINEMKKLSQSGLAQHRAMGGNWVIKSHTQKKVHAYNANYHIVSKEGKKGIVIRAYK